MSTKPHFEAKLMASQSAPPVRGLQSLREDGHTDRQSRTSYRRWYWPMKATTDWLLALILFLFLLPIMLVTAMLVKLTSVGPVLYTQTRLGRSGRSFRIVKFRTMVHRAEAKTGAVWSKPGDPRITKLGRFLRETHVDEFPQLLNVLMGQMSLVGPRPERPEITSDLEWHIPQYRERLAVKPGITGLAQVNLPADSDLEGVQKKLEHDLYYINGVGPWLDFRILMRTGWNLAIALVKIIVNSIRLPTVDEINQSTIKSMVAQASNSDTASHREQARHSLIGEQP